jgi:hypothetical protein
VTPPARLQEVYSLADPIDVRQFRGKQKDNLKENLESYGLIAKRPKGKKKKNLGGSSSKKEFLQFEQHIQQVFNGKQAPKIQKSNQTSSKKSLSKIYTPVKKLSSAKKLMETSKSRNDNEKSKISERSKMSEVQNLMPIEGLG